MTSCSRSLPEALIEDPHDIPEILDRLPAERVSFDATITRASDIGVDADGEREAVADRRA